MGGSIKVYEYSGRYYISGFDYAKLMNVDMGIDSQMGYYVVDSKVLEALRKGNYQIQEETLKESQIVKISQEYRDKYGDTIKRMKMFSYEDLLLWKKNLDENRDAEDFDPRIYALLEEEIEKREADNAVKDELLNKMLGYFDELKTEYGEELVNACLKKVPAEWEKYQESNGVHK